VEYFVALLSEVGVERDQQRLAEAIYEEFCHPRNWTTFPDVFPVLESLKERGYILGVVSDWGEGLVEIIHSLGLSQYFDFIVVSSTVQVAKPDRQVFRLALKRAGARAFEAVHVGDLYLTDVLGARAAGITPILVDRRGLGVNFDCLVINSLELLPSLLERGL